MSVDYSGALLQSWLMIPGHRRRQRPTQHIAIASPPPVAILPVASCQAPHCSAAVLQCCTPMIDGDSLPWQLGCIPQQVASSATLAMFGAECGAAV